MSIWLSTNSRSENRELGGQSRGGRNDIKCEIFLKRLGGKKHVNILERDETEPVHSSVQREFLGGIHASFASLQTLTNLRGRLASFFSPSPLCHSAFQRSELFLHIYSSLCAPAPSVGGRQTHTTRSSWQKPDREIRFYSSGLRLVRSDWFKQGIDSSQWI